MNHSGQYQSSPQRKRGKEDINRNFEFQYQETNYKGLLDNDREEHASASGDTLEEPPKKIQVLGEMEAVTTTLSASDNTSTSLDNAVKKDNDTQHNIDLNKDVFYVENEVSNSHQLPEHVSITINTPDSTPAPLNTSDSDTKDHTEPQTETPDVEMKETDADPSTPEVSSAEAHNQSGASDLPLERETPDTEPLMKPPEDDHLPSPAETPGLGITRNTFLVVSHSEQSIQISNTLSKEENIKSLKDIKYTECKSAQNDTAIIRMLMKPEEYALLSHQCTDQSKPNQRIDHELLETTHNDSDSDNEEAGAQEMRRLQDMTAKETTDRREQRRRKCQRLDYLLIGSIVGVILLLAFIIILVFQL